MERTIAVNRLCNGCRTGNVKEIQCIVDYHDVDIHYEDDVVLRWASNFGQLETIRYLIKEHKCNPHLREEAPLLNAVAKGHLNVVKYFVEECNCNPNAREDRLLKCAVDGGHIEIVKYLISSCGAIPHIHIMLGVIVAGRFEIFKYIFEKAKQDAVSREKYMSCAVTAGHFEIVEYLYTKGGVNTDMGKGLTCASRSGNLEMVEFLVDHDVDIHFNNDSPLIAACNNGHHHIVQYLIEKGANVMASDSAPLRVSCSSGYLQIVKLLVQNGADIHIQHDAPLSWAGKYGYFGIVEYLIEKGADISKFENILKKLTEYRQERSEDYKKKQILLDIQANCYNSEDIFTLEQWENMSFSELSTGLIYIGTGKKKHCFVIRTLMNYISLGNTTNPYTRIPFSRSEINSLQPH